MKYSSVVKGEFLARPNRFVAEVLVDGVEERVHVKNTGRCRELLVPGAEVYLSRSENLKRKMPYDLIAVKKSLSFGEILVNIDSSAPNKAAGEWLAGGLFSPDARIFPERTYGDSRFDFYVEDGVRRIFLEVKGVTLEEGGVVRFPDAPTQRGIKHVKELEKCLSDGYEAYILFVIQLSGARWFEPNDRTHKAFGDALRHGAANGVRVLAVDCLIEPDEVKITDFVEVRLGNDIGVI